MPDHHPALRARPPLLEGLGATPAGGRPTRSPGGATASATTRGPGGTIGHSTRCSTSTGSHALTLDHVGPTSRRFCDGEPDAAARLEEPSSSRTPSRKRAASPRPPCLYEEALSSRRARSAKAVLASFAQVQPAQPSTPSSPRPTRALCGDLAGCTEAEASGRCAAARPAALAAPSSRAAVDRPPRPSATTSTRSSRTPRAPTASSARSRCSTAGLDMTREWQNVSNFEVMQHQASFPRKLAWKSLQCRMH